MNEHKVYNTKHRDELLNLFASNPHKSYSSSEIIAMPEIKIGEATVYRLLSKLTDEGKLNKIISSTTDGARYQYHPDEPCDNHFHLRCTKCGDLICTECSFIEDMEKHLSQDHEFTIDPQKTVIYGICKACKGKECK